METTVRILERSNWVAWPEGVGWADHPSTLIDDVMLYIKLRERARWEVEHGFSEGLYEEQAKPPDVRLGGF